VHKAHGMAAADSNKKRKMDCNDIILTCSACLAADVFLKGLKGFPRTRMEHDDRTRKSQSDHRVSDYTSTRILLPMYDL
jgi:hypothetical protein